MFVARGVCKLGWHLTVDEFGPECSLDNIAESSETACMGERVLTTIAKPCRRAIEEVFIGLYGLIVKKELIVFGNVDRSVLSIVQLLTFECFNSSNDTRDAMPIPFPDMGTRESFVSDDGILGKKIANVIIQTIVFDLINPLPVESIAVRDMKSDGNSVENRPTHQHQTSEHLQCSLSVTRS